MGPYGSNSKDSTCSAGDPGSIPGSGRSPGEVNGYLIQYSCQENSMDRGAWRATVHGVAKSWTRLSDLTHAHLPNGTHTHVPGWQADFIIFLFPQYVPPLGLCFLFCFVVVFFSPTRQPVYCFSNSQFHLLC